MKYDHCLTSLSLNGKIPEHELKETAAEYQAGGMAPDAAMIRAVEDKLELMQMEEGKITRAVREAYEAQGGKKKPAKAKAQPKAEPKVEPKPSPKEQFDAIMEQASKDAAAERAKQDAIDIDEPKKVRKADVESTAHGMLFTAQEHKAAAFKRVKALRQQIKDASVGGKSALRLELIKAESRWHEYQQMERDANSKIAEDAAAQGVRYSVADDPALTDVRKAKTGKPWSGRLYHGTAGDAFDTFRPRTARSVWFATDQRYAKKYADSRQADNRRTLAAQVTLENPLVIDMKGEQDLPKSGRQGAMKYANTIEDAVGVAQQWGHDGVIFKNRKLTDEGYSSEEVAVFNPDQIQIDQDIRYSVKEGVPQAEFGPVHTEYRDDVAGAVSRLMADKDGEAIVHRADVGDISLVYGDELSGLEHIAKRRGADFMQRLPGLLQDGLLYSKPGQKGRVFLGTDTDEAVLRLEWDGQAKTWLLSAYEKYPDLQPAGDVDQSRRSQTVDERSGRVMNKGDLRKAVTHGVIGKVIGSMIDAGVVVLHDKPSQLPRELGTNVKGVQAVTTPDGKIHLVASNLTPANARAVMLHEAFHEGTEKLLGQEKWAKLMGRAGSLYRQAEGSSGKAREVFDRARQRVAAAKAKGAVPTRLEVEEFAAYTIEEYERAPDSLPAAMRKWVEDLIGTVKAWLVKRFDKQLGEITPAQLAAYAKWAVLDHAAARRGEIFGDKGTWFSVNAAAEGAPGADVATDVARAEPQSIIPEKQGLMRRAQATAQDKFNRVQQVQNQIMQAKGLDSLPEKSDAYLAEGNRPGIIAAGIEDGERKLFNPLMERLGKSGYTQEQLGNLLHAMHAGEKNATIAKINEEFPDGGSGMTNARAAEIIKQYKDATELHAMADQARAITKKTLAMKLKYERIDQETYDTLTNNYKYYVPTKGDGEYGPGIKRAMGHEERDEHILANIRRDHDQAIVTGEKNVATKALVRLALQNPEPDLWTVNVAPKGRRIVQEGGRYVVYRDGMKLGEFKSEVEAQRQSELWAALGQDHFMNYEVQKEGGERVKEFVKQVQDNEIVAYFKGHPVRMQLNDEDLARQLRPLLKNPDAMSWVVDRMRGLNRWKAVIYTGKNPVFIPKNMARDAMTGTINMTGNYGIATAAKAWTHYPAAFWAMFNYARTGSSPDKVGSDGVITNYLNEYRHHGGKVGASHMGDLEQHTKTLTRMFEDSKGAISYLNEGRAGKAAWVASRKALSALGHSVEIVNQAAENALRLALYTTLREQGVSPGKAAQAAKTVTVDFDRKGEATGLMSAAYLFINPAIQGTANLVNTMAHGKHKQQAWGLVGALALAGMAAAGASMDDDKDRWLGTEWDTRTKNLILNFGGRRISIPLSQEYAPFYAFGVAMAEAKRGESAMKTSARLLSSFIDAYFPLQGAFIPDSDNHALDLGMSVIPSAFRPHAETAVNRSGFGKQIVTENDFTKNRPDNLKMSRGTKNTVYDKAAQAIAAGPIMLGLAGKYENDFSKVSPETLKHLWRTYAGGLGQFIADSASVTSMLGTAPGQVEVNDVPIVKEFIKNPDFKPLRSRYYELAREAESAATEFQQAHKAGDGEAVDRILKDGDKARLIKLGSFVTKVNKATAAMEDQKVDINADPKLGPAEKRAKLKEIEQVEEQLYRQAIGVFK